MSGREAIEREARLIMLRELHAQPNRSMTSTAMKTYLLDSWLLDRPREWVEAQYAYLEHMGAVRITPAGSVKVATILDRGLHHLALKVCLAGVDSPSEPVL